MEGNGKNIVVNLKKELEAKVDAEYREVALHNKELAESQEDDLLVHGMHIMQIMNGYEQKIDNYESLLKGIEKLYGHASKMSSLTALTVLDMACTQCGRNTVVCGHLEIPDEDNSCDTYKHDCLNPKCNYTQRDDEYGSSGRTECPLCKGVNEKESVLAQKGAREQ